MAVVQLDVGRTNVKLILADPQTGAVLDQRSHANSVIETGPYPHFDTAGHIAWIKDGLRRFAGQADTTDIVPVAHGACVALVDDKGLVLPILDYGYEGPDSVALEWAGHAPLWEESFSPPLPGGLNFGRQLYWLQKRFPEDFARAKYILPYPQYWSWLLTGAAASEVTSYGCHSDLWNSAEGRFADVCEAMGWTPLIPALRKASDIVGYVRTDWAAETGLPEHCRVRCGIHDSNASLLPHLGRQAPFSVVSTGTWAIIFAVGGRLEKLDPARDCLTNTDIHGRTVSCARFMGGREYEILTQGCENLRSDPTLVSELMSKPRMISPGLIPGIGPFPQQQNPGWKPGSEKLDPVLRRTAAGLYVADMVKICLELTGADGPVIVEGPFADNKSFMTALPGLIGRDVIASASPGGTLAGAIMLCGAASEKV